MPRKTLKINTKTRCSKCAVEILSKELMNCCICKEVFHLDCTNVTIKRFFLMRSRSKKTWKCSKCCALTPPAHQASPSTPKLHISKVKEKNISNNINNESNQEVSNVTMRKARLEKHDVSHSTTINSSELETLENKSVDSSLSNDSLQSIQSLPNFTENDQIVDLKDQLNLLTAELNSAHDEITKLNVDVIRLTKNKVELERQIQVYKKLLGDEIPTTTKKSTPKRIRSSPKRKRIRLSLSRSHSIPEILTHATKTPCQANVEIEMNTPKEPLIPRKVVCHNTSEEHHHPKLVSRQSSHNDTIHIFGGKQTYGLASTLLHMRQNYECKPYKVSSFVQPGAPTANIVDTIQRYTFSDGDKIIISAGEHDENLADIISRLDLMAKYVHNCSVIVMNVRSNHCKINVNVINDMLRHFCLGKRNFKFANIINNKYNNKSQHLRSACSKINSFVDQLDYKETYYNFGKPNTNRLSVASSTPKTQVSKKGTIPYYFGKDRAQKTKNCAHNQKTKNFSTPLESSIKT